MPDIVERLRANQERTKQIEAGILKAAQPPITAAGAKQIEDRVLGKIAALRQDVAEGHARKAMLKLYPGGAALQDPRRPMADPLRYDVACRL